MHPRSHDYKLFKPRSNLLIRSKFFSNRIIELWNSLPPSVINAPSISAFKNRLDKLWMKGLRPIVITFNFFDCKLYCPFM